MHRPLASLNADYPRHQRHLGWMFGYLTSASSTTLEQLVWREEESKWGCPDAAHEFPSMRPGKAAPVSMEHDPYTALALRSVARGLLFHTPLLF